MSMQHTLMGTDTNQNLGTNRKKKRKSCLSWNAYLATQTERVSGDTLPLSQTVFRMRVLRSFMISGIARSKLNVVYGELRDILEEVGNVRYHEQR